MDKILEGIENNIHFSEEIKKELISIYQDTQNSLSQEEKSELKQRIDYVFERMFKTAYSFSVPMEFINSPIGVFLLKIKLDIGNVIVYGISELVALSKRSKAMIFNDFHSGKLIGMETGNRRLLVTEEAAYDYLISAGRKPLSPEEAKFRIKLFNKMVRDGYDLDEIKEKI